MAKCRLTDAELELQIALHVRLACFAEFGPRFCTTQRDAAAAVQELLDYRRADPAHVLSTVVTAGESRS